MVDLAAAKGDANGVGLRLAVLSNITLIIQISASVFTQATRYEFYNCALSRDYGI